MSDFTIIHHSAGAGPLGTSSQRVKLSASRVTLAKRRWRGVAEDGREFGFDLEQALGHGIIFHLEEDVQYVLEQEPEEVVEIPVSSNEQAARIAWSLGNLHFALQVRPECLRVVDDPAVQQLLSRNHIPHRRVRCVFVPLAGAAHHHHG